MNTTSTAARCYYAPDPKARPGCQLTATVRVGSIPLCGSCADRRSTLGKGQPVRPLTATTGTIDPLDWVAEANTDLHDARRTLAAAVLRAHQHGHSWAAIADRLGTTRQAAQQRFREAP